MALNNIFNTASKVIKDLSEIDILKTPIPAPRLNIALCDDIMGMIGQTVKARRGMAECLTKIKDGGVWQGGGLSPHEDRFRLAGVMHEAERDLVRQNLITGEITSYALPNEFWSVAQDIGDVSGADGCDIFEYMTQGEYDESILYRWSECDWFFNSEDAEEPDDLFDPSSSGGKPAWQIARDNNWGGDRPYVQTANVN